MYKLLLHIGYPKTATTSLQEGCFLKLHERGVINYLGRTVTSTHTSSLKADFDGIDWAVEIRKKFLFEKRFKQAKLNLAKDKLNVLSDEDLCTHPYYHEAQFGVVKDPHSIVLILKEIIPANTDVTVLLTIRNQAQLIKSFFLQKYRFVYLNDPKLTFEKFLLDSNGVLNEPLTKTYDFNVIAGHYEKELNAKINVLFFEDLKYDPTAFFSALSAIINVPKDDLSVLLNDVHYRNRTLKRQEYLKAPSPFLLGKLISLVTSEEKFRFFWARISYMRNSAYFKIFSKFFIKRIVIPQPDFTGFNPDLILASFSDCNSRFAKTYGCSIEKMKEYGYILPNQ
jgi:hypothetical protein